MPTIASSVVPPPKSWDEFEDITLAAAKLRWKTTDFERHGRTGQKQDGVDVYGRDTEHRLIGVQCKNTVDGITLATVNAEILNAEAFVPELDALYIATTAKRDASLQKDIRTISESRRQTGKFGVIILFWDDVCQDLATNDQVFFSHYPQIRAGLDPAKEHDRDLWQKLTALLKSDGVIGFLDQNNMAGFSFPEAVFNPLREFYYEWNRPEREFISPELESLRAALWKKVDAYTGLLATNTWPTNNPDRHTVPPEWEIDQPERFWRVVKAFHELAGEIVDLHRQIVRVGRAQLIGH
jgi:hypothetical protein